MYTTPSLILISDAGQQTRCY